MSGVFKHQLILYPGDVALVLPGQNWETNECFWRLVPFPGYILMSENEREELVPGTGAVCPKVKAGNEQIFINESFTFLQNLAMPEYYLRIFKPNYPTRRSDIRQGLIICWMKSLSR